MIQLSLLVPEQLVEAVSDALIDELDALSVSVEDADADSDAERALFGEPGLPPPRPGWARSTLSALFASEESATEAATLLLAQDWTGDVQVRALEPVPDQDWVRLTQAQFGPVEITSSFWIVPSWHAPPAGAKMVIRLDPGLAFGTGSHPTTRMCLRWIARHAAAWPRVLDYGCGSGILAIAAALHGAREVDAVDIDPAAVASTRTNAQANGVVLHAAGAPNVAQGPYELVLANILAKPLELLAPVLARLAAGGDLVLAGILERQAESLRAAYAPWCALGVGDAEDGWVLMTARLPR
jgi:ribosomal protein L11 methyltransferase